jgi:mono/diheme cytochrome c family protein
MNRIAILFTFFMFTILASPNVLYGFQDDQVNEEAQADATQTAEEADAGPDGGALFQSYCKACHNINMRIVGPPLKDVHQRRSEDWLMSFIKSSQTVIQSGDSVAIQLFADYNQGVMPDQTINEDEIRSIIDYIKAESEVKVAANPISRPAEDYGPMYSPLQFNNFRFWILYTITVLVVIALLWYMVEASSIKEDIESHMPGTQ